MPGFEIAYTAPPTLGRFLGSDALCRAVVGPFGSGKSSACVIDLFRRACMQKPGRDGIRRTRWAIVRNTYRQLQDTTRKTFEEWIPRLLGHWRESEFMFQMKFQDVVADFMFRALDRPADVRNLLSLELTGAWVNEAREISSAVFNGLRARIGRYPAMMAGGPTWSGISLDTNPWPRIHWGYKLFSRRENVKPHQEHMFKLFEQPGARTPEAENLDHLFPGYYDNISAGQDSEWVDVYVDSKYPVADRGSFWGKQIAELEARGGLQAFSHELDGVFTTWDLGHTDSTAIWFWRLRDGVIDVIDHYENSGQALSHYFEIVKAKPYQYVKHWLPHDARAKTLQTGVSTVEMFVKEFGSDQVAIGPELSIQDGISAGRWLLEQPIRIHPRCEVGLEAIKAYHREWNENTKDFGPGPVHDWSSHSADSWRYTACVVKRSDVIMRKPEPPPKPEQYCQPVSGTFTLDQLWAERERGRI